MTEQTAAQTFRDYVEQMLVQKMSPEETIALYVTGADRLAAALAGLTETDLDLSRAEDKWTIRQIVHHIVDGDDIWSMCIKVMTGHPGCTFGIDWYEQDSWVQAMGYQKRPIEPALALFRARRQNIAELLHNLPDAWERNARIMARYAPEGFQSTVAETVFIQAYHVLWHVEQIRMTRQVHGR